MDRITGMFDLIYDKKQRFNFLVLFVILVISLGMYGCALKTKHDKGLGYSTETSTPSTSQHVWQDNFQTASFIDRMENVSHAAGSITLAKDQPTGPSVYESRNNTVISIDNVNPSTSYGVSLPAEKGTLELWVKGDFTKTGYPNIVNGWGANQIFVRGIGDGKIQIAFHDTPNSKYIFLHEFTVPNNLWNFIAVTWDMISANANIYLNGVAVKSGTISNPAWRQSQAAVQFANNGFAGQISRLRILSTVLSEADIMSDYSSNYKFEGEIVSNPIEPVSLNSWGTLDCDLRMESSTSLKTSIEYEDNNNWKLIPDADLNGNYTGFSKFPVNLSSLKTAKYKKIRLKASLETSDAKKSPELKKWSITNHTSVRQRPYLFVDEQLIQKIRLKVIDLANFHQAVRTMYENRTNNLSDVTIIRQAMDSYTDPAKMIHHDNYVAASMNIGMDAFFNNDQLSFEYGKQYILSILNRSIITDQDSIAAGRLYALGSLYDWINNYLDNVTKKNIREYILSQIDYADSKWMHFSMPAYSGGHSRFMNGMALVALLSIAEDIGQDDQAIQNKYNYYYEKIVNNWRNGFNPTQEWIAENGGYVMGWAYGPSYTEQYPYRVWEYAGNNESWFKNWQNELTYFYLYGIRNLNNKAKRDIGGYDNFEYTGDVWNTAFTYHGDQLLTAAGIYNNEYAKWLYNQFDNNCYFFLDILYKHFDKNAGTPPNVLPLSRHFKNSGFVVMRDSWDFNSNTLVTFKSSSYYSENHHHKDQNSFTIYYKGPLAIDSGGYHCMGAYGSKHWWNYYTRSIAHNTILVYDPDESFVNGYSQTRLSNDGGQKFFRYGYPVIEQMKDGGENHLGGIQRYQEGDDYTYTMGDATKAYSETKLEKFERSIINIRNYSYNHPVVVVYDKVVSRNQNFKKTYLLHSIKEPEIMQDTTMIEINDGMNTNNKAVLFQKTLLPARNEIVKIGGLQNSKQFYIADDGHGTPHNYDEGIVSSDKRALREAGEWRVEISPADASRDDRFLNVISITDGEQSYQQVKSEYVGSLGIDGLIIRKSDNSKTTMILFLREQTSNIKEIIDLNSKMIFDTILIVGMIPNNRIELQISNNKLYINTNDTGSFISSAEGVIEVNMSNIRM